METFTVFALLSLLFHRLLGQQLSLWLAIAFLSIALLVKPLARFVALWWLKLSEIIAGFNSRILLTLAFYLVLTPIAVIYRFFTRAPLSLRNNQSETYYAVRNHTFDKSDLEKLW